MNSKRMFFVLIGCLIATAGIAAAGVFFGDRLLQKSAKKLNDAKLETSVIDEQQNSLAQAKRDIDKYSDLETIAKTIVPQEKDQARTVREIVKFAGEAGVPISSITFPTSELGVDKSGTSTSSSATSKTTGPTPISQVTPVEGIKGVYQMEVTIQNDKDKPAKYTSLISFLKKLEQNRRTSQVTDVGIQPDPKNRAQITYTMTINVYIKP